MAGTNVTMKLYTKWALLSLLMLISGEKLMKCNALLITYFSGHWELSDLLKINKGKPLQNLAVVYLENKTSGVKCVWPNAVCLLGEHFKEFDVEYANTGE